MSEFPNLGTTDIVDQIIPHWSGGVVFPVHCRMFSSTPTSVPWILVHTPLVTTKNVSRRDFPGGPVVKTSPSNAGGEGSIPGRGAKIPHDSQPKNQNIKQKQYWNKFNRL